MNPHRGTIHHMNINVSDLKRSLAFYGPVLSFLGYERAGSRPEGVDWKRWLDGTPHEISIIQADEGTAYRKSERRAVGRHNHIAFCAEDRDDVDAFYEEVLKPLEEEGLCTVEDPPCDCPEYDEGYYAAFFFDPDGLKFEFVINPQYQKKRRARMDRPLEIVDHQFRWAAEFAVMGNRLRTLLGDTALRIDHIGSTSVPGLGAKDIIDLQITVVDLGDMEALETRMKAAGFRQRGDILRDCFVGMPDSDNASLEKKYFREAEGARRHHMHVREEGRFNQRYPLLFRDYLRANPVVRDAYEIVKRRLVGIFPDNIDGYLSIKDPYMDTIYAGAEHWARNVGWKPDDQFL